MSKRRAEAVAMMNAESNKFRLRAERAEAAIQRVRELCEAKTQEVAASDPLFGPPCALYVDDILRALDGGAE